MAGSVRAKSAYDQGREAKCKGDSRGALRCFQLALKLNKGHPAFVLAAAEAHQRLGETTAAASLYERAKGLGLSARQAAAVQAGLALSSARAAGQSSADDHRSGLTLRHYRSGVSIPFDLQRFDSEHMRLDAELRSNTKYQLAASPVTLGAAERAAAAGGRASSGATAVVPTEPVGRGGAGRLNRDRDEMLRTQSSLPLRAGGMMWPASARAESTEAAARAALRHHQLAELAQVTHNARLRAAASTQPVDPGAAATKNVGGAAVEARRRALDDLERATKSARARARPASASAGGPAGMRFGTEAISKSEGRDKALQALAAKVERVRQQALTREHVAERAWDEQTRPTASATDASRWRCPRCNLVVPDALRTCTSCLHHCGAIEAPAGGRRLMWRKTPTGRAHKQSVAAGHTGPRWGVV